MLRSWPFGQLKRFGYRTIAADNPWKFVTRSNKGMGRSPNYQTMTLEEIKALPVKLLARRNDDVALLFWCTGTFVNHMPSIIEAWGFEFKGRAFEWAKPTKKACSGPVEDICDPKNWKMNLGYGTRKNVEDCWLGTRGSPQRLNRDVPELIVEPLREHSRKPEQFYERAERLYPGPYCDLFSRENRPGWDSWGDQAGMFNEEETDGLE